MVWDLLLKTDPEGPTLIFHAAYPHSWSVQIELLSVCVCSTLHAIATRVRHARQTTITVASSHARAIPAAKALRAVAIFLRELAKTAEQLTGLQRWRRILARAFQVFLQGRQLRSPPRLAPS